MVQRRLDDKQTTASGAYSVPERNAARSKDTLYSGSGPYRLSVPPPLSLSLCGLPVGSGSCNIPAVLTVTAGRHGRVSYKAIRPLAAASGDASEGHLGERRAARQTYMNWQRMNAVCKNRDHRTDRVQATQVYFVNSVDADRPATLRRHISHSRRPTVQHSDRRSIAF